MIKHLFFICILLTYISATAQKKLISETVFPGKITNTYRVNSCNLSQYTNHDSVWYSCNSNVELVENIVVKDSSNLRLKYGIEKGNFDRNNVVYLTTSQNGSFTGQVLKYNKYVSSLITLENHPLANINSVAFDLLNNRWFGTSKGLYNENKMEMLSLSNRTDMLYYSAENIFCDFLGRIWYSSNDVGYGVYNPSTNTFVNFSDAASHINSGKFSQSNDSTIFVFGPWRSEYILLNTKLNFDKNEYNNNFRIKTMTKNSAGKALYGTNKYSHGSFNTSTFKADIYLLDPDTISFYSLYKGLPALKAVNKILTLGDSIIAATDSGYFVFKNSTFKHFTKQNSWLPENKIVDITFSNNQFLFVYDNGFTRISLEPGTITSNVSNTNTNLLSVYPNPVIDVINFSKAANYTITDLLGREYLQGNGNSAELTTIPSGTYVLKLNSSTNQEQSLMINKK